MRLKGQEVEVGLKAVAEAVAGGWRSGWEGRGLPIAKRFPDKRD